VEIGFFLIILSMLMAMAIPACNQFRKNREHKDESALAQSRLIQIRCHRGDHRMDVWLVKEYKIENQRVLFTDSGGRQWDIPLERADFLRYVAP